MPPVALVPTSMSETQMERWREGHKKLLLENEGPLRILVGR